MNVVACLLLARPGQAQVVATEPGGPWRPTTSTHPRRRHGPSTSTGGCSRRSITGRAPRRSRLPVAELADGDGRPPNRTGPPDHQRDAVGGAADGGRRRLRRAVAARRGLQRADEHRPPAPARAVLTARAGVVTAPGPDHVTVLGAPVGEAALGPPAFMHRASAAENPAAPLAHHILDSTHIARSVIAVRIDQGGLSRGLVVSGPRTRRPALRRRVRPAGLLGRASLVPADLHLDAAGVARLSSTSRNSSRPETSGEPAGRRPGSSDAARASPP